MNRYEFFIKGCKRLKMVKIHEYICASRNQLINIDSFFEGLAFSTLSLAFPKSDTDVLEIFKFEKIFLIHDYVVLLTKKLNLCLSRLKKT